MGKAKQSEKLNLKRFILAFWPLLFIIFIWLVFSHLYFLKGLIPFPSDYLVDFFQPWNVLYGMPVDNNAMPDVITQIYPWKQLVIDSWKNGQIPKWNPYQFAGNPHLANYQSAAFSPFNLLFFVLSFVDAWSLLILFQPLLAGLFMYLYMRSLQVSKSASVFSAVSFMFSGFIVVWMAYGTLAYAILFLPLALYGIERWYKKKDLTSSIILVLSIPLSLFSGHFQTSFYFLLAVFLYIVFSGVMHKNIRSLAITSIFVGIGILLSLPQLLASIEFYQQSVRSELFQSGGVIPINYLISVIAPDFFGNPVTRNDWFGYYAEWAGFAGSMVLSIAFFSLWSIKKNKKILFFLGLSILSLAFAYSQPLSDFIISLHIPVISTSASSRIIVLFSFSVAVLSGYGIDTIFSWWQKQINQKEVLKVFAIWFLLLGLIWLFLLKDNLMFISDTTSEYIYLAKRNFILPTLMIFGTFAAIMLGYFKRFFIYKLTYVLLLAALSFDMLRFATKWMPFEPREYVYPEIPVLNYLKNHAGNDRVFGNIGNEGLAPFKLYGIEGYDPLYIDRYGELVRSTTDGNFTSAERSVVKLNKTGDYAKKLLDLLGVKYILYSKGDGRNLWSFPFWWYEDSFDEAVYADDYYEVYINKDAYPRSFIVYDYQVVSNKQDILGAMFSNETDLSKIVILEKDLPKDSIYNINCTQDSKVSIDTYSPNYIQITANSSCAGLLFLSDNYYPRWQVYVNGQKTDIYRANYSFRAVEIPSGQSSIEFKI